MTGFNSKREATANKLQEPVNLLEARKIAAEYGTPDSQVDDGNLYFALSKCLEHIDAQPAQEPVLWITPDGEGFRIRFSPPTNDVPLGWDALYTTLPQREWIWLSDADIAEVVDTTCQYSGGYEEYLIKKAERKIKELNT